MTDDFAYDVFVSYRHVDSDRAWVRDQLVPRLMGCGLRVCVDYRCFVPGRPLTLEMERAVLTSRYTVPILTPAYLTGSFAEFENLLATHLELEQQKRRLLAVMRETCRPSLRISYKLWIDMTDDAAFAETTAQLCAELHRATDD
jgi:TIR domain